MNKLDPKAIRLFTILNFITLLFIIVALSVSSSPFILASIVELDTMAMVLLLIGLIILSAFVAYGWAVLTYNNYRYSVGEDAFKKEQGVISKRYVSIPYDRIQNIDIHRGILSRLLGLSDLQIQTAGYSFSGKYGANSEGRLPALSFEVAEKLREDLIKRAKSAKSI